MTKKILAFVAALAITTLFATAAQTQAFSLFGGGGGSNSGSNVSTGTTCGETQTQYIACDSETGVGTINDLIRIGVIVMSTLIGVVAVGGLVYAAMLYASARDNQNQISSSIDIIRNIVIGLVMYVLMLAIINWLIPGSVIG